MTVGWRPSSLRPLISHFIHSLVLLLSGARSFYCACVRMGGRDVYDPATAYLARSARCGGGGVSSGSVQVSYFSNETEMASRPFCVFTTFMATLCPSSSARSPGPFDNGGVEKHV